MGFFTKATWVLVPAVSLLLTGCAQIEDLFTTSETLVGDGNGSPIQDDPPLPPGVLEFTLPSDGASITSPMLLKVYGSEISSVRFMVDGSEVSKDTNQPYEFTIYPNVVGEGEHTLGVEVTHSQGVVLQERDVRVTDTVQGDPAPEEVLAAINSLQRGHWFGIPNSKMRDVAPDPAPRGNTGVKAVISTWCSGAFDTERNRLIVWGGGHQDYSGNEIYAFDLDEARWVRLNDPSPFPVGDENNSSDKTTHPDGSPISRHTYGYIDYLPELDRLYCGGGAGIWKTGQFSDNNTYLFDFESLGWSRKSDTPASGISAACAVGPDGRVWQLGAGRTSHFASYNPETDVWTKHVTWNGFRGYGYVAAIDAERNRFILTGRGKLWTVDLSNPSSGFRERTSSGATEIQNRRAFGFVYHPGSDRMVAWNGGSDVYTLNPETFAWTKHATSGSITPGEAAANGTYGRFRYVPGKDIFIVVNSINENVFVYKLP